MRPSKFNLHCITALTLLLTAAFLVGCGGGVSSEQATTPMPTVKPTPTATPSPEPVPTVLVAVATKVDRLPRSEDNNLYAQWHRVGEDGGAVLEIRRDEIRRTRVEGQVEPCLSIPLERVGWERIWDSGEWSGWDPYAVPMHDPYPGSWIWSLEVVYQGQLARVIYQTDKMDRGPVLHAFLTAGALWDEGEPGPCAPTPSLR